MIRPRTSARRSCTAVIAGAFAEATIPKRTNAKPDTVVQRMATLRSKATARGIADDTSTSAMVEIHPEVPGLRSAAALENFQRNARIAPRRFRDAGLFGCYGWLVNWL